MIISKIRNTNYKFVKQPHIYFYILVLLIAFIFTLLVTLTLSQYFFNYSFLDADNKVVNDLYFFLNNDLELYRDVNAIIIARSVLTYVCVLLGLHKSLQILHNHKLNIFSNLHWFALYLTYAVALIVFFFLMPQLDATVATEWVATASKNLFILTFAALILFVINLSYIVTKKFISRNKLNPFQSSGYQALLVSYLFRLITIILTISLAYSILYSYRTEQTLVRDNELISFINQLLTANNSTNIIYIVIIVSGIAILLCLSNLANLIKLVTNKTNFAAILPIISLAAAVAFANVIFVLTQAAAINYETYIFKDDVAIPYAQLTFIAIAIAITAIYLFVTIKHLITVDILEKLFFSTSILVLWICLFAIHAKSDILLTSAINLVFIVLASFTMIITFLITRNDMSIKNTFMIIIMSLLMIPTLFLSGFRITLLNAQNYEIYGSTLPISIVNFLILINMIILFLYAILNTIELIVNHIKLLLIFKTNKKLGVSNE